MLNVWSEVENAEVNRWGVSVLGEGEGGQPAWRKKKEKRKYEV